MKAATLKLKNVAVKLQENNKKVFQEVGEITLESFGIAGPLSLKISCLLKKRKEYSVIIDLKPGMNYEKLKNKIQILKSKNYVTKEILKTLLPQKLITPIFEHLQLSEILTKKENGILVEFLKNIKLKITSKRSFKEAIVTQGGIDVKEINPKTMESKIVEGLYFAGEVIDVDALTGGYNLQIAFSTAAVVATNL